MTAPRTLEEKQAEKSRLWRAYRAAKKQQWAELCAKEPRMAVFRKAVRRMRTGAELLVWLADHWVRCAEQDVRHAALQQINRHADRMARAEGRAVLDDPLPPATNVFLAAREMLAVR